MHQNLTQRVGLIFYSPKQCKKFLVTVDCFPHLYEDLNIKLILILYFCADLFSRNFRESLLFSIVGFIQKRSHRAVTAKEKEWSVCEIIPLFIFSPSFRTRRNRESFEEVSKTTLRCYGKTMNKSLKKG